MKESLQVITVYVDDCYCTITSRRYIRNGLRTNNNNSEDPAADFNDCLNSVHPRVKFTREEEENQKLAFLDVLIIRKDDGSLTTQIYRKESNTNVIIGPNSCHDPQIHTATFKGEICRASRICSTPKLLEKDIAFTLDVYQDNGHNREKLETIAKDYKLKNRHRQEPTKISSPFCLFTTITITITITATTTATTTTITSSSVLTTKYPSSQVVFPTNSKEPFKKLDATPL